MEYTLQVNPSEELAVSSFLERADPDTLLEPEEREIGGLGIFLVKKTMDDVSYRFEDGQNILTIRKKI
jgi:anti-sigma regulatory factor (Ser/Thr protein kinase)